MCVCVCLWWLRGFSRKRKTKWKREVHINAPFYTYYNNNNTYYSHNAGSTSAHNVNKPIEPMPGGRIRAGLVSLIRGGSYIDLLATAAAAAVVDDYNQQMVLWYFSCRARRRLGERGAGAPSEDPIHRQKQCLHQKAVRIIGLHNQDALHACL